MRAELGDDFLPHVFMAGGVLDVQRVKHQPGCFEPVVMARDAIFGEDFTRRCKRRRDGGLRFSGADRAVARGAKVLMPVQDMFWGARYGKLMDPYGHEWGINQQLKEQTAEETQAQADEFFAKQK